jgi:hypothetical protein
MKCNTLLMGLPLGLAVGLFMGLPLVLFVSPPIYLYVGYLWASKWLTYWP